MPNASHRSHQVALLGHEDLPQVHDVMDEAALHRAIGGPDVMDDSDLRLRRARLSQSGRLNRSMSIIP
jgi:hypothetical protein